MVRGHKSCLRLRAKAFLSIQFSSIFIVIVTRKQLLFLFFRFESTRLYRYLQKYCNYTRKMWSYIASNSMETFKKYIDSNTNGKNIK